MQIVFLILLFIFGACLGSFLCCEARRLHLREGKTRPSAKKPQLGKRSICLHCGHQLKWYENLPILSWLILKGKCHQCGEKIGLTELLSELGVGLAFLFIGFNMQFSGITISTFSSQPPLMWASFASILAFILILSFLAICDGLYGQLPTIFLTISIICAIIIVILREWATLSVLPNFLTSLGQDLLDLLFAVLILGGVYLVLYLVSKGKWVGDGDWLLGTAIGLVLGTPWFAIIVLFLSNFLACLVMFPIVKKTHHTKIYFGPFMVVAFVIVYSFSSLLML